MEKLEVNLAQQVPVVLAPDLWAAINPLYIQLHNLAKQVNRLQNVVQSPNGHYWKITVSNVGTVTATDLGTVLP